MKTILVFAASLFVAAGAFAQGTIVFVNFNANFQAPVYGVETLAGGGPLTKKSGNSAAGVPAGGTVYTGGVLAGTGYTAELWGSVGAGQSSDAGFTALGRTTFRTGGAAGFMNSTILSVPGAALGGQPKQGTFEVRVWDNLGGTIANWAAVLANPAVARGQSALLDSGNLGGTGTPGATDPTLENLRSFNLAIVPEPSSIALGVLGLGTLMFLRRRK